MDEAPLTRFIRRLEAATSRLEDIASSAQTFEQPHGGPSDGSSLTVPSPGQMGLQSPSIASPGVSQSQLAEPSPQSINDFDTLLRGDLQAYRDLSNALGGVVAEQVGLFTFG
jgi:adenylyl cyclase-associated protein